MNLNNMTDEQILEFIAQNLEKKRLSKQLTTQDLAKKGGFSAQTFSNFLNKNSNIRMITLIQILKGLDELNKIKDIFEYKEEYSPLKNKVTLSKRVRSKNSIEKNYIKWGEDK